MQKTSCPTNLVHYSKMEMEIKKIVYASSSNMIQTWGIVFDGPNAPVLVRFRMCFDDSTVRTIETSTLFFFILFSFSKSLIQTHS